MKTIFLILILLPTVSSCIAQHEGRGDNSFSDYEKRHKEEIQHAYARINDSTIVSENNPHQHIGFVAINRIEEQQARKQDHGIKQVNYVTSRHHKNATESGRQGILPVLNQAMKLSLALETLALFVCCILGVMYRLND